VESVVVSCLILFDWSHKHKVSPDCVSFIFFDYLQWIDDITSSFGHFASVRSKHHALVNEFLKWFGSIEIADIEEEFVDKSTIEEMPYGVFFTTTIKGDREYFVAEFFSDKFMGIVCIRISEKVE